MINLPRTSYTLKPWKNGQGMTEEIHVYPEGSEEFLFRVSMAALTGSGPFSLYPGIDRSLVLLEGTSIRLNDSVVSLLSPVNFSGEEVIFGTIETEGRDLNLMCRRGKASGKIEVLSGEATFAEEADVCLIFALTDDVTVGTSKLSRYDTCLLRTGEGKIAIHGERFLRIDVNLLRGT